MQQVYSLFTRTGLLLWQEARAMLAAAYDWRLPALIGFSLLLLTIAAQVPLQYRVYIGQQDGPGADQPLISGFFAADNGPNGQFRWSGARSAVRLPGFGSRALPVQLRILPITQEIAQQGPKELEVWSGEQQLARLPVYLHGATYHLLLPVLEGGDHRLELRSATFVAPGDTRKLASPVGELVARRNGFALPSQSSTQLWLLFIGIGWLVLRQAGFSPNSAIIQAGLVAILLGIAAALDPPRAALGALPFLRVLLAGWLLVTLLRFVVPPLFRRAGVPFNGRALAWLLLFVLVAFCLRYGGKSYPGAMPGDVQFHSNRYQELVQGRVLLQAPHRGVQAPYPPAFYLVLAPFSLLGLQPRLLLQGGAALLDAISPLVVYAIAVRAATRSANFRMPLVAAGYYALSGGGFLATWWNFSTHIFAQCAFLLLVCIAVQWWYTQTMPDALAPDHSVKRFPRLTLPWCMGLVVLQCLVYLGHFSFYINTTLLAGGAVLLVLVGVLRKQVAPRRAIEAMLCVGAAQLMSIVLFFSAYLPAFRTQTNALEEGTTIPLASDPVALGQFWASILGEGLRDHLGLFPVIFSLCSVILWSIIISPMKRLLIFWLISGSFFISSTFLVFPFFSSANLTTRWLMFSLWAVAVAGAPIALYYWRRGRAGRLFIYGIGFYILCINSAIWVSALAWRVRPPEPF